MKKPYKLTDTIDDLFIQFFEEHHKDMLFRTHGKWLSIRAYVPIIIPFHLAKSAVAFGYWETIKENYAVSIPFTGVHPVYYTSIKH